MDDAAVVAAFVSKYVADREQGRSSSLHEYQERYPGYEALIAREYAEVERLTSASASDSRRVRDATNPGSAVEPEARVAHYRIVEELARGGQGQVFVAEDLRLHRQVALKILKGAGAFSPSRMRRFQREAEVASRLNHPGICTVFDAGTDGATAYIAMRLVAGESLAKKIADRVAERRRRVGQSAARLSGYSARDRDAQLLEDVALIERAALALHAAHEAGIVHRDVKPGNLMVSTDGEPVLLDFGLAFDSREDASSLTESGDLFGTPAYMSPERLSPKTTHLDRRTDVYSLGVTLFELLTLHRPFEAPTRQALYRAIQFDEPADPRLHERAISKDLAVVLSTALERDLDRRYQTALDFAEELRRVREREPIRARPVSMAGRALRWAKRRPAAAALIAAMALGIPSVGVLTGVVVASRPTIHAQHARERKDEVESLLVAGFSALAHGFEPDRLHLSREAARDSFQRALELDPKCQEATCGLCMALTGLKQNDAALAILDRVAFDQHRLGAVDALRARVLRSLGRSQEAMQLEESLPEPTTSLELYLYASLNAATSPEEDGASEARRRDLLFDAVLRSPAPRALYYFSLAENFYDTDDPVAARRIGTALTTIWPDSSEAWRHAAGVWVRIDLERSLAAYRESLRLDPRAGGTHYEFGLALRDAKQLDDAIASLRRALELRPELGMAHQTIGRILMDENRLDEALLAFDDALRIDPKDVDAYIEKGITLENLARYEDAAECWKHGLEVAVSDADAATCFEHLANAEIALNQWQSVLDHSDAAIAKDGTRPIAHQLRGMVLFKLGRYEESIRAEERAIELGGKLPARVRSDAWHWLAMSCQASGQLDRALEADEKDVVIDPSDADAHYYLARHLDEKLTHDHLLPIQLGPNDNLLLSNDVTQDLRWDREVTQLREALRLNPDHGDAGIQLATLLNMTGHYKESLELLHRAYEVREHLVDPWDEVTTALLQSTEADAVLEEELDLYVATGKTEVTGGRRVDMAVIASTQGRCLAAARLFRDAVRENPAQKESSDLALSTIAYPALRASQGDGEGAATLSADERAEWRRQALEWFLEFLEQVRTRLQSGAAVAPNVFQEIWGLRADRFLKPFCETTTLNALPEPERKQWQRLFELFDEIEARARR